MNIKLAAFDLDDTLLNEDLIISSENLEALKKISESGTQVILCSGRPKGAMDRYIKQVEKYCPANYGVAYNGAQVYDKEGKNIFISTLGESEIKTIVDIAREWDITLQLYSDEYIYVEEHNEYVDSYLKISDMKLSLEDDLKNIKKTYKALYNYKPCERFNDLKKCLEKAFPDCNVFYSKPEFLEVIENTASKGNGIKQIAEILGIKREEILCIGDGLNDLSMIEYAGVGVAMLNANDELKQKADYISNRTNNEDVAVEVYERFIKG